VDKKTKRLNIYTDVRTYNELAEWAKEEDRTKSKLALLIIRRAIEQRRQADKAG